MKRLFLAITIIASFLATDIVYSYDEPLFCRSYRKKKPFALKFPNLAVCLNAAQPYGEVVGTIEWCRKSYTRVGVDECGRTIQWRATDITYRYVLCNGAYGECFTKTQVDGPIEYVEAVPTPAACTPAKGVTTAPAKGISIFK